MSAVAYEGAEQVQVDSVVRTLFLLEWLKGGVADSIGIYPLLACVAGLYEQFDMLVHLRPPVILHDASFCPFGSVVGSCFSAVGCLKDFVSGPYRDDDEAAFPHMVVNNAVYDRKFIV